MERNKNASFIPVLTSMAGSCLTRANWQEVGVQMGSFHLVDLLMRPGYENLYELPALATYVGWTEGLILNASLPPSGSDGLYHLRSIYDGRRITHSLEDIFALIIKLLPSMVILPEGDMQQFQALCLLLPDKTFPFIPVKQIDALMDLKIPHGVYVSHSEMNYVQPWIGHKEQLPLYIAGDIDISLVTELLSQGINFVESNQPAHDGYEGRVYCSQETFSIQQSELKMQFNKIDEDCTCPTCNQNFSRAYLHHLFEHTPLLGQRLLIQHNAYWLKNIAVA